MEPIINLKAGISVHRTDNIFSRDVLSICQTDISEIVLVGCFRDDNGPSFNRIEEAILGK